MLTAAELGAYIDERLTRSAFRLELLDRYTVDSDGYDFERFKAGADAPTRERKQPWLDRLRAEAEAGIHNHRVHVLSRPLNDYLRYECEWGYVYNAAAGEDIRILDATDRAAPKGIVDHDFWLIDDEHPIRMYYSPAGEFLGAEPVPHLLGPYQLARTLAVSASEPFNAWWQRHPEEWREHRAA